MMKQIFLLSVFFSVSAFADGVDLSSLNVPGFSLKDRVEWVKNHPEYAPPKIKSYSQLYNQIDAPPPAWLMGASAAVNEFFVTFFKDISPKKDGSESFNVDEGIPAEFLLRLRDTRLSAVIPGKGTVKALGGPLFYNTFQGGVGLQYDFIVEGESSAHVSTEHPEYDPYGSPSATLVALRVFPTYGEIAFVRVSDAWTHNDADIPKMKAMLGTAFGLELSKRVNWMEAGAKVYARPMLAVNETHDYGSSIMSVLYFRMKIADLGKSRGQNQGLFFSPYIAYYDLGAQKEEHYLWKGWQDLNGERGVNQLRRFWETQLTLELRWY